MSASGAFGPAPPGIDLSETKNGAIIRAVVSLMVIGTLTVMLRFVSQLMREKGRFSWDDYLILPALLLAHGTAVCSLVSLPYGGGKHLWAVSGEDFTTIWQILFSYVMIYAGAVSFTKASIVMYYWRLFRQRWSTYLGLFLVWSYFVVVVVTINTGCQPLEYFWTRYTTPGAKGHCIDVPLFFFANGIWAMLVDVCILIIPIRPLLGLRMSTRKKIMVGGVLGLGGFVCIASIVRVISIHQLINNDDLTWSMASVFIWSCCEPFIGILCACMPCYAPLLRRFWKSAGLQSRSVPTSGFSSGNMNGSTMGKSGQGIPIKVKRDWDRIVNPTFGDDEVQLTTYTTGPGSTRTKGSDESGSKGITVKTDIHWESHAV
ncbi:uncharacterized protein A1O5_06466 [Cladophialophora psammophila CBS 110553]|uniref:Rhodopsin domain-containing protein n=1 Tax=Cladophialophora psammophila CBS 110553 TaxID=1182543 RepID=W9WR65_9EURO|nr:uncharacterized protein A1O5_06466 [Cladophialophora psammophila CBS 110553]EXJ70398.1 hypothetical protein A1O5_06466 [Cladophialophora psammophila CBS 110553]